MNYNYYDDDVNYVVAGTYEQFMEWKDTVLNPEQHVFIDALQDLLGVERATVFFVGTYKERPDYTEILDHCRTHGLGIIYVNKPVTTKQIEDDIINDMKERDEETKDILDLEQEIMDVWNSIADFDALIQSWESLSDQKKRAVVVGMRELYDCKMQILFHTFESLVRSKEIS